MKEFVELVVEWSAYRDIHPDSSAQDFFRYMLAKASLRANSGSQPRADIPIDTDGQLMMAIGRTALAYQAYLRIAIKSTELTSPDHFTFLAALNHLGESKKTDVANFALMELSTGSDIINRLIKAGYITERSDMHDKRSKLVRITDVGRQVLQQCFKQIISIRKLMFDGLTEEDKQICIQLLFPIQAKHAKLAVESKHKSMEEIVASLKSGIS